MWVCHAESEKLVNNYFVENMVQQPGLVTHSYNLSDLGKEG